MKQIYIAVSIATLVFSPAQAARSRGLLDFLFGPPPHYRAHRHVHPPRSHPKAQKPIAPAPMPSPPNNGGSVDCASINEGIKALDPERLILALRRATEWQKQTIERCAKAEDR